MITKECEYCGKEFKTYPSHNHRFCCHEHASLARVRKFNEDIFRFDINEFTFRKPNGNFGNYDSVRKQRKKKYPFNEEFFKKGICDEATAYIYGLILTDGTMLVRQRENGVYTGHVSLKLCDEDIIEKTKKIMKSTQTIKIYQDKDEKYSKQYALSFHSTKLFHDLNDLGCTRNKTIETEYPFIPPYLDRHFIRGVIDGDGSWSTRKNRRWDLTLKFFGTEKLLYGIYLKIKEHLNVEPSGLDYPIDYDENYKMDNYCVLRYNKFHSVKIRDWIYKQSSVHCDRKYKIAYEY